jgi:hypothetical protein
MRRLLFPILFAFVLPACPATQSGSCASVCANMARLGCPSARPTAKGAPCVEVCDNLQNSGIVKWDLACRARAESCEAADACEAK